MAKSEPVARVRQGATARRQQENDAVTSSGLLGGRQRAQRCGESASHIFLPRPYLFVRASRRYDLGAGGGLH